MAASSEQKPAVARQKGSDARVVYPAGSLDKASSKAFAELIRAAFASSDPDVILDVVGGDYAEAALTTIARQGRFLVVGFAAGIPQVSFNLELLDSAGITGVAWSEDPGKLSHRLRHQLAALVQLCGSG